MKKRNPKIPPFILFLLISFIVVAVFSLFASVLFKIDLGRTDLANRMIPPSFMKGGSPDFFLGTDSLGRDFGIRLVYAIRNSLIISILGMIIASIIGTILGILAGLYGGWVDALVSFIVDTRLSIPFIIIAIICASIFGSSKTTIILIIGLAGWASFARLVRGQVMQLKESNFIECSRSIGASWFRILFEHLLVNISSPLIVHATMRLSSFMLLESTLSFLGLGIQPPDVSLGVMVSEGRNYLINFWWLSITPSMFIVVIVFQVSLIGDWLRDKLDPKLQGNS